MPDLRELDYANCIRAQMAHCSNLDGVLMLRRIDGTELTSAFDIWPRNAERFPGGTNALLF